MIMPGINWTGTYASPAVTFARTAFGAMPSLCGAAFFLRSAASTPPSAAVIMRTRISAVGLTCDGWQLGVHPDAHILHKGGGSFGRGQSYMQLVRRNRDLYFSRYPNASLNVLLLSGNCSADPFSFESSRCARLCILRRRLCSLAYPGVRAITPLFADAWLRSGSGGANQAHAAKLARGKAHL